MLNLSAADQQALDDIAKQHGFSRAAVISMLESMTRGRGTMAQFDHAEFGGPGQWMGSGMTMVSDMFNDSLKARVAALCADLAKLAVDRRVENEPVSLVTSSISSASQRWWPAELGSPTSTGSQNAVRYAYFADARRLAIDLDGHVTVYDTLDHRISRFSQEQSRSGSMSFHSQHGLIDVSTLPVMSGDGRTRRD